MKWKKKYNDYNHSFSVCVEQTNQSCKSHIKQALNNTYKKRSSKKNYFMCLIRKHRICQKSVKFCRILWLRRAGVVDAKFSILFNFLSHNIEPKRSTQYTKSLHCDWLLELPSPSFTSYSILAKPWLCSPKKSNVLYVVCEVLENSPKKIRALIG